MRRYTLHIVSAFLLLFASACGGDEAKPSSAPSVPDVDGPTATAGQGGAQDIGIFRAIVESGGLPGPDTLDTVGFFNEHAIEPPRDLRCADPVCVHARVASGPSLLNDTSTTAAVLTLSTQAAPDLDAERPPLNLAIAVDTSQLLAGPSIESVRKGLVLMLNALRPDDRVSLIAFDTGARLLIDGAAGDDPNLLLWINNLRAEGSTDLYSGLRLAFETVEDHRSPDALDRVVLLMGSWPSAGIVHPDRLIHLVEAYAQQGVTLSTIGLGANWPWQLANTLASTGAGNFYTAPNPTDVEEIFTEELNALLLPVAVDVDVTLNAAPGWRIRAIHGAIRAEIVSPTDAWIHIPSVTAAAQGSADPNTQGRRGGGGAILVELVPNDNAPGTGSPLALHVASHDPATGDLHERDSEALSPTFVPGELIAVDRGAEEAFVMLHMLRGLRTAARYVQRGNYADALGTLIALQDRVNPWLSANPDEDILDDMNLARRFDNNLRAAGALPPGEGWVVPDDAD